MSTTVIVGIDEAGRGPLAGPVVAGACVINVPLFKRRRSFTAWSPNKRKKADDILIADSKSLSPELREIAFEWITQNFAFGFGMVMQEEIDAMGILAATERAMHLALKELEKYVTPTYLLVDGRDAFWFDYPHSSIIRGDSTEACIAAASIVAKVTRDRWITKEAEKFPQYGFKNHKGYAAPEHIAAIQKHGPCALHRMSFLTRILETKEKKPVSW